MGITHICQYGDCPYNIIILVINLWELPYNMTFLVIKLKITRIRDLREDKDLKQKELSKYLSIDQSTYSDYENGRINVPIEQLIKIADYYNVSLDYIVGRTNNTEINK